MESFLVVINHSIKILQAALEENNKQTQLQNKRMLQLTWAIAFFTVIMIGMGGFQIYLTI